ncbi:MAG TPA: TRAP transporter small permease [Syntrophorhabdales bacterium]|nr:TRAP transporter small permease [Syntrophorhabdales bacterium]
MLLAVLKKIWAWYEQLEELLLVFLVFGMVALGAAQILFRNVISIGLVWIDPLLSHLVLWVALLGASIATRENRHIVIEIIPERLSLAIRSRIKGSLQLFSALVCLFLVYPAVQFILNDYRPGKYLALGIPLWASQTVMPVMWLVLGIRFLLQGFKNFIPGKRV